MASKLDLDKLGVDELKMLARDIEKAIKKREADNLKKARDAAEAAAREYGYTLEDVTGIRTSRRTAEPSEPKFRNPEDPTQAWSGRGRQPGWFKDAIASGRTPEDLAA